MRKAIRFRWSNWPHRGGQVTAFSISFSYTDRFKSQSVVRELVTKFTEQNPACCAIRRNHLQFMTAK